MYFLNQLDSVVGSVIAVLNVCSISKYSSAFVSGVKSDCPKVVSKFFCNDWSCALNSGKETSGKSGSNKPSDLYFLYTSDINCRPRVVLTFIAVFLSSPTET